MQHEEPILPGRQVQRTTAQGNAAVLPNRQRVSSNPMGEQRARGLALRSAVGLPASEKATEEIARDFQVGWGDVTRDALAAEKQAKAQKELQDNLQRTLTTVANHNGTKLDQLALESLTQRVVQEQVPQVEPSVVIEQAWGEELTNGHNIKVANKALDADPAFAEFHMQSTERLLAARAVNADILGEIEEKWAKSSFASKATDVGALFVPWYSNGVLAYTATDASIDPGQTVENEFDYWVARATDPNVSLDQYRDELREHLASVYKASPLDAMELGRMLTEFNSADRAMYTAMGVGDVLGSLAGGVLGKALLGIGKGAKAAAKRGPSSLLQVALKNKGASTEVADLAKANADLTRAASGVIPDLDAVKSAGGAAEDVATRKGVQRFLRDFDLKSAGEKIKNDLDIADEIPGLYNLPKLTGKKLTPELTEMVRKTNEQVYRRRAMLLEGVNSQVKMPRVDENQIMKGLETFADDINRDYANLQESIMGVRDVPLTVDDKVNVVRMETIIGTKKGGFFSSRKRAENALKQTFDEGKNSEFDFKVESYGDSQYYISVMRDLDETSVAMETIPVKNATPSARWTFNVGGKDIDLRGAKNLQHADNYDQSTIATYGMSGNLQARLAVAQRTIKQLSGVRRRGERKTLERFMDYQSNSMNPRGGDGVNPGWWSEATDDFVLDFKEFTGSYPTQRQMDVYYAYKDVHSFDHVLQNLNMLTRKRSQGRRMFKIRYADNEGGYTHTPGIEGKRVQYEDIPWTSKHGSRVAFIDNDKVELLRSKGKVDQYMEENLGEWKFIQIGRDGRAVLSGQTPYGVGLKGKHVDYIAVRDFESEGLPFNQIPYRDGPPRSFDRGHYTSQPDLEFVRNADGEVTRVFYKGDINLMQHATTKESGLFGKKFNEARALYSKAKKLPDGKEKATHLSKLRALIEKDFPWWGTDEFIAQMEKKFNPDVPVMSRVANTNLNNAKQVEKWVKKNFRNADFEDGFTNPYDLDNAIDYGRAQKREPLAHRVAVTGDDENPVFSLERPMYVDPATTISRQVHEAAKARYFDDLKMQYANQFTREFADVIDATSDEIKMNPVGVLLHGKVIDKGVDPERIKAAKIFQRHAQNFNGIQNSSQRHANYMIDRVAQWAYERFGVKGMNAVHDSKVLGAIQDPATLLRTMSFHSSMGFWNPIQLFVQSQTHANVAALEGIDAATRGMSAAWVQGALFKNFQKGMPEKVARHASSAMGWEVDHFLEAWEGLKRSGFWNVGTEVVQRDALSPSLTKSGVLDSGLMFFEGAEAFTRRTAYNAAYYKWRMANPTAPFDNAAQIKVLSRADFTTNTMGRNAKAAWNNGWMSVPTQFWNWNARMLDNFMGKEITNAERIRLVMVHSMLYGVPVGLGAGVVGQVVPMNDIVRDELMKREIDYDESIVGSLMVDGLMATVMEGITGTKWNVGERYGTGSLPIIEALYDYIRGTQDPYEFIVEAMGGAPMTTVYNYMGSIDPAGQLLNDAFDINSPDYGKQTWQNFLELMSRFSSTFNNARQADMARRYAEYTTRGGNPVQSDLGDQVVKFITGLSTQQLSDDYRAQGVLREMTAHQSSVVREASKLYQQGMREHRLGNHHAANKAFTEAKMLVRTGAPDDKTAAEWMKTVKERTARDRSDTYKALKKRGYHDLERRSRNGE